MTVSAVILAATPESALADAEGLPRVRRLADVAWSGGALPVVVVADDPGGAVSAALAGAPVTLAEPAPAADGPVGQIAHGVDVAREAIRETDAALIWPARMAWVGPETVTSLIEAHGANRNAVLRPTYDGTAGWPVLLPLVRLPALRALAADRTPDELIADLVANGADLRELDLGDPGSTHDGSIARADLPPYRGPKEPVTGQRHEWDAAISDTPDGPLEGPALSPFEPAGSGD
ncbi:MAG TPA: NTP transferase domain-containing protein [Candidatus Limnocylindria bacterium]|nr:NTP transferase domain-containing protein [Candidatus Limnocylindria bacterium]